VPPIVRAGGNLPTDLGDEGFEPFGGDGAASMVILGERRLDRQLVADEQRKRFELDMPSRSSRPIAVVRRSSRMPKRSSSSDAPRG
jgi:hypothetical protein